LFFRSVSELFCSAQVAAAAVASSAAVAVAATRLAARVLVSSGRPLIHEHFYFFYYWETSVGNAYTNLFVSNTEKFTLKRMPKTFAKKGILFYDKYF
jgi:hypothetical protein